jgi:hypothetical protein
MPIMDAEKRRQYQRDWQRAKRNKVLVEVAGGFEKDAVELLESPDIGTPGGIRSALNEAVGRLVVADGIDPVMFARGIASLCSVALKFVEVADIAQRLDEIEAQISRQEANR